MESTICRIIRSATRYSLICLFLTLFSGELYSNQLDGLSIDGQRTPSSLEETQTHLLFTSSRIYQSMYVEIDYVEGSEPTQESLQAVHSFLERACDKPHGISVVLDDAIPQSEARNLSHSKLALKFIDGPKEEQTAFLYILYYNSKFTLNKKQNPHFTFFPYPAAIFIDQSYGSFPLVRGNKDKELTFLLHEVGHAMGLGSNPAHSKEKHCTDNKCLMSASLKIRFGKVLTGRKAWDRPSLCENCVSDRSHNRALIPPSNIYFNGPLMIRSESNHHVISLNLYTIKTGALNQDFLETFLSLTPDIVTSNFTSRVGFIEFPNERNRYASFLPSLSKDPAPSIRELALDLQTQIDEKRAIIQKLIDDLDTQKLLNEDERIKRKTLVEILRPSDPIDLAQIITNTVHLSDAIWARTTVGWGLPARNHYSLHGINADRLDKILLQVNGGFYSKGLYAHSDSHYSFLLNKDWKRLTATIGPQEGAHKQGSAIFRILTDGHEVFRSSILKANDSQDIIIDVSGVNTIELITESGSENNYNSWAIWASPLLSRQQFPNDRKPFSY